MGEMVSGRRRYPRLPLKPNYYFLAHLQCSLKFACKFVPWYLHQFDKLTNKNYAKTINLLCAGNKVFGKYQAQGEVLTPNAQTLAYAFGQSTF